jgi:DNA polymerase-3 subunit gamma/tau
LLEKILDNENIAYDTEALKLIATAGEGSVRDTLSIADCIVAYCSGKITKDSVMKVLGTTDYDLLIDYFEQIKQKNVGKILELVSNIDASGKNLSVLVKDLSRHARNLLVCKSCERPNEILNLPEDALEKINKQAEEFDERELISYMQSFGSAENELRYTLSPRLLLETLTLSVMSGMSGEEVKKN